MLNPIFRAESLLIESPQLPSPSVNPVINQGLSGEDLEVLSIEKFNGCLIEFFMLNVYIYIDGRHFI